VPVELIEPDPHRPDFIGSHLRPTARLKYATDLLATSETSLAEYVARYNDLNERGRDTLPDWERKEDERGHGQRNWTDLDQFRASHFRLIRYDKGRIAACQAVIAQLEALCAPLFHWR
jgi:hypothetical protein